MAVNGINGGLSAYTQYQSMAASTKKASEDSAKPNSSDESGVSVEFSSEAMEAAEAAKTAETKSEDSGTERTQSERDALIQSLNQQMDAHVQQMQNLVNELLGGKSQTTGLSLADIYRQVAEKADPETIEQAKKDIAEDGEWGVEKTSERMFEMAKALSGDDPTKADEMIAAVKKGLEQAAKSWGEDLPEISKKTVDATIKKLEDWRDGLSANSTQSNKMSDATQTALTSQAQAAAIAGVA